MLRLTRLRPSNLIILAALPFIVWLFATAPDYSRSLRAIVGVEPGGARFVPGFLLMVLAAAAGLAAARLRPAGWRGLAAGLSIGAALLAGLSPLGLPFAASVVANAVDPFTSPLVVPGETPRHLTGTAEAMVGLWLARGAVALALLTAAGYALTLGPGTARRGRQALVIAHGALAAFLLLFAYLGFAAGVATSIRAAIIAYLLAICLGLGWVGMMQLKPSRATPWIAAAIVAGLAALALWQMTQPRVGYALVGAPQGTVGVVKGTPGALIGAVQDGLFPGAPGETVQLRTFLTPAEALAGLGKAGVTAVFLPEAGVPAGAAPIWRAEALPDANRAAGTAFLVVAIIAGLLALGGALHRRHPLSVGAEFIIDTIRGIPMLVIVLYIGLPLAGAVKDASGGFIDPPNLLRGILAMAIAYSAYLAEIFRSGINAVPTGQIEAARSLGLSRWQTARHVILPQAFRIIIPPLGNEFIAILKDTSLLSILSIRDITQRMREFQSASFLPFAPYNSAAIFYVLLTLVAASLVHRVERRFHVARR
ncbi:MAG: amino acid ABC transporter permease [Proteobacteria bacterium]|nr:amino acid ABC transporter permease [Pseudomonadota bacterium]